MSRKKRPGAKGSASGKKTPAESPAIPMVAQPHGGALRVGNPGNAGGGRPRSLIRDDVLVSFDGKSRAFLDEVVTGQIVSRMRIPLISVGKHFKCKDCGGTNLEPASGDLDDLFNVNIEVEVSATVAQRIAVAELQARYGLGAVKEITVDNVRARVNKTLDVLQARLSTEQYTAVCKDIAPIWG